MRKKCLSILAKEKLGKDKRQTERDTQSKTHAKRQLQADQDLGTSATPTAKAIQAQPEGIQAFTRPGKRAKLEAKDDVKVSGQNERQRQFWSCHSVVDRQAAAAVSRLLSAQREGKRGASIKSLTLAPHIQAKKSTFKVTCETLRHLSTIQHLLQESGLLQQQTKLSESVAYVLCYEAVFGEGLRPHGPAERAVLAVQEDLIAAAELLRQAAGVAHAGELAERTVHTKHPRTARVNTLKISVKGAMSRLRKSESGKAHSAIKKDELLPDVLSFPAGTDLHDHPLVASGCLILQSKASCMPAHALKPKEDWTVLDACAAPGNKTTHVAALMNGKGRVLAFDRDPKRLERLKAKALATGAGSITARCQDFLEADLASQELASVQGVILDPSCSGSGTVQSRMDYLLPASGATEQQDAKQAKRIIALADFQKRALKHALNLPKLQRLVYSTCSVHAEENEHVVAAVLHEAEEKGFGLVDPFPAWRRRGLPIVEGSEKLIRTDPAEDGTDGFFIAVFERTNS